MSRPNHDELAVREMLSSPYYIARNIKLKEAQIVKLREMATKTTASYTAERISGTPSRSKIESCVVEIEALIGEIEQDKAELVQRLRVIRGYIAQLDDWRQRNVLEAYHINCIPIWRIANEYNISEAYVKYLLKQGRLSIKKML